MAAWAQFSCPRFGPRAHRPLSSLGTVLAGEVHAPPDASLLASIIGPINPPSPVTTGCDQRARDEPTVPTPTPPRAMDTSSHGAGRAQSLSAPRACTAQTRARPLPARPPRDAGAFAATRSPRPRACRAPPGRSGVAGSAAFWGGTDPRSCGGACAPAPCGGVGHHASAGAANGHPWDHATRHRPQRCRARAARPAPARGPLPSRSHLDD